MEYSLVQSINRHIQGLIKGLRVTGSYKRKSEIINDLDYITKKPLDYIKTQFKDYYDVDVIKDGERYIRLLFKSDFGNLPIDIWYVSDNYEYYYACLMFDMDKAHSIYWKKQALKHNYHLSNLGLKNAIGQWIDITNKQKLRKLLEIK